MPARNIPAPVVAATRSKRLPMSRRQIDTIVARREQLVAEINLLLARGETSQFAKNARKLLSRSWASANWHTRENLLKAADWLVRLEYRNDPCSAVPATAHTSQ